MGFSKRLAYYLVHSLSLTYKQARDLINSGEVKIDGVTVHENCFIADHQEIAIKGAVARPATKFVYLKFYKPRGYQSSLNKSVPDNLSGFFKNFNRLFIAGRLDKESEGLLLLSNDGKWVETICNPESQKEKEYLVELNDKPDSLFFEKFRKGVLIGDYITRPCVCVPLPGNSIRIILKEGKNRQIRRMCKVLGFDVITLKRTRIDSYVLSNQSPGSFDIIY